MNTLKSKVQAYYHLTKPGIIRGNLVTASAGFFLASKGHINVWLLLAVLTGISLVIASACVCNNYIDQDIDALMSRTKKRALVSGLISGKHAIIYAFGLGLAGLAVLFFFTNILTVLIGLVAFVDYVVLYGFTKRRYVSGTIIGSISGAAPPLAAYVAVTGSIDVAGLILFLILVCWQMPHFYAIAMYRNADYARAKIPVLPVVKGMRATKIQILLYIVAFVVSASLLTVYGYTGYVYLVIIVLLGVLWFRLGVIKFKTLEDALWGRKMFLFSLVVISVLSLTISLANWLP